jgi:hypothetical protein
MNVCNEEILSGCVLCEHIEVSLWKAAESVYLSMLYQGNF